MGIHARIYSSDYGRDPLSVIPILVSEVLVVNAEGPFEPKPGDQLVRLESGPFNSVRAIPVNANGSNAPGLMFGGRYIASSDSRFGELAARMAGVPFYGAVALHDRLEQ